VGDLKVIELKGQGASKSRPFEVPAHAEYFVVRWTSSDNDTDVYVHGVPPYSCYESFDGKSGEGVVYETGRFYVEVSSDGPWEAVIEAHIGVEAERPSAGVLNSFTGTGSAKTRPFAVPNGIEYFVVKWTSTDDEFDVTVEGVEPTSCFESFSGGRSGEGLVYETGRFYIEVEAEGSWQIDVILE
jgi:hypothetical protein